MEVTFMASRHECVAASNYFFPPSPLLKLKFNSLPQITGNITVSLFCLEDHFGELEVSGKDFLIFFNAHFSY